MLNELCDCKKALADARSQAFLAARRLRLQMDGIDPETLRGSFGRGQKTRGGRTKAKAVFIVNLKQAGFTLPHGFMMSKE